MKRISLQSRQHLRLLFENAKVSAKKQKTQREIEFEELFLADAVC